MKIVPIWTFVAAFGLLWSAGSEAGEVLKHAPKYEVGATRKFEITTQTKQLLTIAGMPLETAAENFMVMQEQVEATSADGSSTIKGGFDSIQVNLNLPGGLEYQFNSANPDATKSPVAELDAVTDLFKTLSKCKWITKSGKDGKVESVKYEGDGLSNIPEQLRGEASEENMFRQTKQEIEKLPGKSVEVGDSWERHEKMELGSGQIFEITKKYTYTGPAEHQGKAMHRITSEVTAISYDATQPFGPLEYKSSELKPKSSEGTLWYDPAQGIVVDAKESMTVEGDMKFSVNGNELPATLDLTITIASKTVN